MRTVSKKKFILLVIGFLGFVAVVLLRYANNDLSKIDETGSQSTLVISPKSMPSEVLADNGSTNPSPQESEWTNYEGKENPSRQSDLKPPPIPDAVAQWQMDVGIMNAIQISEYAQYQIDDLQSLSASGDQFAKSRLGLLQARAGDIEEAEDTLIDAVANGSIGAALLLRDIYLGSATNNIPPDYLKVFAWQRIAETMGHPPDLLGETKFASEQERIAATVYFHETLNEIQRLHYERFGEPLPYRPQPK